MTKPVTATAVLMLQDDGKLSVDDPVAKYLPELANLKTADGKPAKLTLRHLLTHTSGMGEATPQESRAARKLADLIPHFADKAATVRARNKMAVLPVGNQLAGKNRRGRLRAVVSGVPPKKALRSAWHEGYDFLPDTGANCPPCEVI